MNMQELKAMIGDQVSQMNLNGVLDDAAIEQIKLKVMSAYNHEKAINEIPEMIPEAVMSNLAEDPSEEPIMGPEEGESIETVNTTFDGTQTPGQNVDQGTSGNIPEYTPELPSFLDKVQPGKVIIFSQNELSESGENLSLKPIRTFADPDVKKSMRELWLDNGQKKAEVFLAKLEKIGEMEYDFSNGTTVFAEKRFDPDFEAQAKYKENPYAVQNAMNGVTSTDDSRIVRQIASSVDLQKTVEDIVMRMLQKQIAQDNPISSGKPYTTNLIGTLDTSNLSFEGGNTISANVPIVVKENFDLNMRTIVDDFQKIDTPKKLKEALDKNDKTLLVRENSEVQEWLIEGNTYYTPVNKISTRKCYTK